MPLKARNFIAYALVGLLFCSLPFAYFLSVEEYFRLGVLGLAVFALFCFYKGEFKEAFWRRALAGLVLAYAMYACDPAATVNLDLSKDDNFFIYTYALIAFLAALAVLVGLLVAFLMSRHQLMSFFRSIKLSEWLTYVALLCLFSCLGAIDRIAMLKSGAPQALALATAVRPLTVLVAFIGASRLAYSRYKGDDTVGMRPNPEEIGHGHGTTRCSYDILLAAILIFVGYALIFGGARAGLAMNDQRMTEKFYEENEREYAQSFSRIMRAYSLCEEEAAKIYRLGYEAGMHLWSQNSEHGKEFITKRRNLEKEAYIAALFAQTQDFEASFQLDGLPKDYRFTTPTVTQNLQRLMVNARKDNYKLYVIARMYQMMDNPRMAAVQLNGFLEIYTNHPSGFYFLNGMKNRVGKTYTLPCDLWLQPQDDAAVERTFEELVMLNGRSVAGWLWLPQGHYTMTLYAKDEGADHGKAKEAGFDPSCKAQVWVGDQSFNFTILSPDHLFHPYAFEVDIESSPTLFTVYFTNDKNEVKGLDRNLGLNRLEIQCEKPKKPLLH